MRSKILTAAFTLATTASLATTAPASAQNWNGNRGSVATRAADVAAGVVGGALAAATLPFWAPGYYGYYDAHYPGYVYAPSYTYGYSSGYVYAPAYAYAPDYAHTPGYDIYAPLYGYYGAYDLSPWSYRGGPHPR